MSYSHTLKRLIYMLKRRFPTQVVFVSTGSETTDLTTGSVVLAESRHTVRRAIVLPEAISILSTSGNSFRLSGGITENTRPVIIDKNDAKNLPLDTDMKLEFDGKTWDVANMINHDGDIVEVIVKDLEENV